MLLRGSSLRNTDWIYGVAIYTGHDSKVMMNSSKNKPKYSKIEIATDKYVVLGIVVQTIVCIISTIFNSIYEIYLKSNGVDHYYLELTTNYNFDTSPPIKLTNE